MTIEHIRAELNDQYIHDFCKKVGVAMRRLNIACNIKNKSEKGSLDFDYIIFELRYVGYRFNMFVEEGGHNFILKEGTSTILITNDLAKVKSKIVSTIRVTEASKKKQAHK